MEIRYLEKNKTYTNPQRIQPTYIVVHSTAVGMTSRMTLFNAWNSQTAKVSCHAMVDDEGWTLTLPVDFKGWHVGGRGNGISIGFEVCEPKSIVYADQWHSRVNTALYNPARPSIRNDFIKRWWQAVDCAAYLCKQTGITPDHVLCHSEMNAIGKATNHVDVTHWFDLFGQAYNMDAFRAAVAKALRGGTPQTTSVKARVVPKVIRRLTARRVNLKN